MKRQLILLWAAWALAGFVIPPVFEAMQMSLWPGYSIGFLYGVSGWPLLAFTLKQWWDW